MENNSNIFSANEALKILFVEDFIRKLVQAENILYKICQKICYLIFAVNRTLIKHYIKKKEAGNLNSHALNYCLSFFSTPPPPSLKTDLSSNKIKNKLQLIITEHVNIIPFKLVEKVVVLLCPSPPLIIYTRDKQASLSFSKNS